MPLSRNELERLADDVYHDRRIPDSLYCDHCGYNLKTLPRRYVCPECGNEYSARPLRMKGIFVPHDMTPPFAELAWMLGSGAAAGLLIWGALNPLKGTWLIVGAVFVVLSFGFAIRAYWRMRRFLKFRAIARRIASQEEE